MFLSNIHVIVFCPECNVSVVSSDAEMLEDSGFALAMKWIFRHFEIHHPNYAKGLTVEMQFKSYMRERPK